MGITRLCAIPLVSLVSLLTLRRGRKEPYRVGPFYISYTVYA